MSPYLSVIHIRCNIIAYLCNPNFNKIWLNPYSVCFGYFLEKFFCQLIVRLMIYQPSENKKILCANFRIINKISFNDNWLYQRFTQRNVSTRYIQLLSIQHLHHCYRLPHCENRIIYTNTWNSRNLIKVKIRVLSFHKIPVCLFLHKLKAFIVLY